MLFKTDVRRRKDALVQLNVGHSGSCVCPTSWIKNELTMQFTPRFPSRTYPFCYQIL
jgi:hypothetical protein